MSETTTTTDQPTRTGAEMLLRIRHSTLSDADMDTLRGYLTAVGARSSCVDNRRGTQTWCHGRYEAGWAIERWVSPSGHDITLEFTGPNPVGSQQNGWLVSRRSGTAECPEWALDDVTQRRQELRKRMDQMHKVRAALKHTRARINECCEGTDPQHSASCGFELIDGARRLRQACQLVRSWAELTPPNDLGNTEVATAIAAARVEAQDCMTAVDEAQTYAGV